MKVLHLLASNRFSGAENVVCQIISAFENEDVDMAYCSPNGPIGESLQERGIPFLPLEKLIPKEVKKAIAQYRPDIVHAHDMHASFVAAVACGKIPFVSHIHNNAFDSRGFSLKSLAYLYAAKKAKHIFWVSQSAFEGYAFHEKLEGKSSVLYNVIDIDRLHQKVAEDMRSYSYDIAYLGRLTYPKNPQRLMRVISMVREKASAVKIAVIGTGELEEETKMLCKTLGLEKNVEFFGFQSNPYKVLQGSKLMVMTSRWEGLPMCVLEATALGVPVVSTPTDGIKYVIQDGENGFLSDEDAILADKIAEIIQDKDLRLKLSDNCVKRARALNDLEKYKDKLFLVYRKRN